MTYFVTTASSEVKTACPSSPLLIPRPGSELDHLRCEILSCLRSSGSTAYGGSALLYVTLIRPVSAHRLLESCTVRGWGVLQSLVVLHVCTNALAGNAAFIIRDFTTHAFLHFSSPNAK